MTEPAEPKNQAALEHEKLQRMLTLADHLNTFGTLTSSTSTGLYLFENFFQKKPHKLVNGITLAFVGGGIAASLASLWYKAKAGPAVLYHSLHPKDSYKDVVTELPESAPSAPVTPEEVARINQAARTANWADRSSKEPPASMQL